MGKNLYLHAGMGFLSGRDRVGGCEYRTALTDGFLPITISNLIWHQSVNDIFLLQQISTWHFWQLDRSPGQIEQMRELIQDICVRARRRRTTSTRACSKETLDCMRLVRYPTRNPITGTLLVVSGEMSFPTILPSFPPLIHGSSDSSNLSWIHPYPSIKSTSSYHPRSNNGPVWHRSASPVELFFGKQLHEQLHEQGRAMFLQLHRVLNSVRESFQRSLPESWAKSWSFGY
jgi:hypothetical protein